MSEKHILIVNFPGGARVKKTIQEIQGDPAYSDCDVVIISDNIDTLPFDMKGVSFVRGSAIEAETYKMANIAEADKVIVLSPNSEDVNSDAMVLGAVNTIRSMTDVRIVAECLDKDHLAMFTNCPSVSVALTAQISRNVVVQEMFDPGVGRLLAVIASNLEGTTLFSTIADSGGINFKSFMRAMLVDNINVLGLVRGNEVHTSPDGDIQSGDVIVYTGFHRLSWNALQGVFQ